MQQNILKSSDVTKIFFCYVDGKNISRKIEVKVRYIDNKSCYFYGDIPSNFVKPKWRTKANVVVYTPDGTYSTVLIIRDTDFSLNDVVYKVDLPKTWKYTQLRSWTRKPMTLPVKIKFNDGLELEAQTYDISIGGFSIVTQQVLSLIHTRFASNCRIQFMNDSIINFPDGVLEADCIYVRKKNNNDLEYSDSFDDKLICFKFLNLSPEYALILKRFLMQG